jgi:Late competence development protein ComFB
MSQGVATMNVLTVESIDIAKPTIENMVSEEIQQQLESLPIQVSNYINKAEAIAHTLNFLHPIHFSTEKEWYWQHEPTQNMLLEIISDAVSLSLIRSWRRVSSRRVGNAPPRLT